MKVIDSYIHKGDIIYNVEGHKQTYSLEIIYYDIAFFYGLKTSVKSGELFIEDVECTEYEFSEAELMKYVSATINKVTIKNLIQDGFKVSFSGHYGDQMETSIYKDVEGIDLKLEFTMYHNIVLNDRFDNYVSLENVDGYNFGFKFSKDDWQIIPIETLKDLDGLINIYKTEK